MNINNLKKIINLLIKKKISISVAESCTGGMLSSAITSVSGSSKVFSMGLVTYSNKAKVKILKIPSKIIKKHGAVSKYCCLFMVNIGIKKGKKTSINRYLFNSKARLQIQKMTVSKSLDLIFKFI